uniref:Alpha-conotoxin-like Vn n=1 Tax=Conus ventricosus TaxID=117992 RepID=CA1A_CONVE|nr:RecName: Full=Alpha-conotoxin-like Vn; AltName: Full=Vn1A [Conus ventricosus]
GGCCSYPPCAVSNPQHC